MLTIRIRQYAFQISRPYAAGTVLTAEEAQALNALRADNIRNNWARRLGRAAPADGQAFSRAELDELQAELTKYDQGYRFGARSVQREGALDREARQVALERVDSMARAIGVELPPEALEAEIQKDLQTEWPWAEASRRLAERDAVLAEAIEELL